jgi:hypothetical protein
MRWRAHQVTAQILAGSDEVAQRLELGGRDDDRPQLSGGVQPCELQRVTRVGLDAIPGLTRDRARRTDHHLKPLGARLPGEPEAGWAGLIDRPDRTRQRRQPLQRRGRRPRQLRLEHLTAAQLHGRGRSLARVHIKAHKADTVRHVDAPHQSMR